MSKVRLKNLSGPPVTPRSDLLSVSGEFKALGFYAVFNGSCYENKANVLVLYPLGPQRQ